MHELALTESIINIVSDNADSLGAKAVNKVTIVVGKLSGAVPESLEFCFSAVSKGTVAENAELIIEHTDAPATCNGCGAKFFVEERFSPCPKCDSFDINVEGGSELYVKEIEITKDDEDAPAAGVGG